MDDDNIERSKRTIVTPEFLKEYDHVTPSGNRNPMCRRSRLANIGVDCRSEHAPVDLNLLTDRNYDHICETNDDGWLIGGGDRTKLKRPDTAHAEVWRFGPDTEDLGGISYAIVDAVMAGIRFAPVSLRPLRVNFTHSSELELLCAYEPNSTLGQVFGLLSDILACPCGDYGKPFHITLARGVRFRTDELRAAYFAKVEKAVAGWNEAFPDGLMFNDGGLDLFKNREEILSHYSPALETGVDADIVALRALRGRSV